MNNPKVYPGKVKKFVDNPIKGFPQERIEVEQQNEGIDLLSHVAIQAMNGLLSDHEFGKTINDDWDDFVDRAASGCFDLAERFLKERETRLNKIK